MCDNMRSPNKVRHTFTLAPAHVAIIKDVAKAPAFNGNLSAALRFIVGVYDQEKVSNIQRVQK